MVIEKGTQVRVKIIGIRSEVGEMWAIGSIKEDYLGYVAATSVALFLFFWRRMGGIRLLSRLPSRRAGFGLFRTFWLTLLPQLPSGELIPERIIRRRRLSPFLLLQDRGR